MKSAIKKVIAACVVCGAMVTGLSVPVTTNVEATTIQAKKQKKSASKLEIVDSGYYVQPTDEYSDTLMFISGQKLKIMTKRKALISQLLQLQQKMNQEMY